MSFKIVTTAALSRNIFQRKKSSLSIASLVEVNQAILAWSFSGCFYIWLGILNYIPVPLLTSLSEAKSLKASPNSKQFTFDFVCQA